MNKIKFEISSVTDTGSKRKVNEDYCRTAETSNGYLCVVCDGMGGHAGGDKASALAVECIIQYMSKETCTDMRQSLREALEFANMQIIGTAAEHSELRGMGSTACVVLIQDACVWLAHAGDSRIYLYVAKEKRLHRLTQDHSYVQGLVNQGIITDTEAERHPQKNQILKALGVNETLNPEVCEQPVLPAKGDIILICSDGLSGMVSDKLIEEILSENIDLKHKETVLMNLAKSAGGLDNITFQMALITGSPYKKSVFESKNPVETPKNSVARSTWTKYIIIALATITGIVTGMLSNEFIRHGNSGEEEIIPTDTTIQIQQNPIVNSSDSTSKDTSNQEKSPNIFKEVENIVDKISNPENAKKNDTIVRNEKEVTNENSDHRQTQQQ
jgi:serine/threonine protein phosphatase PrpC